MIRKIDRRAIACALSLALFLGWSGVAHSQLFTVHQTMIRLDMASELCGGECRLDYSRINSRTFLRNLCGLENNDDIPNGYNLAMFIECDESPAARIGVWDRKNEIPVIEPFVDDDNACDTVDMELLEVVIGRGDDPDRGTAEMLYLIDGTDYASVRAKFGPLPPRFGMDQSCWARYRSRSINGSGAGTVTTQGQFRAGAPIGLFVEE